MFAREQSYEEVSADIELTDIQHTTRALTSIKEPSWYRQHFTGWRFGILNGACLATAVLILNIVITGIAMNRPLPDSSLVKDAGRRVLYEGDCQKASRLNVLAHLLINAMSTLLLSASNYGMQVLSAPTRREIDLAHSKKKWLDIGVLSVRNIKRISRSRALLWFMLGATSLPLHLVYNSAVFSTVSAYEYAIFTTTPDRLTANTPDSPLGYKLESPEAAAQDWTLSGMATNLWKQARNGSLERLSPAECIEGYAVNFAMKRRNLILVTNDTDMLAGPRVYNNYQSAIYPTSVQCASDPFDWICGQRGNQCLDEDEQICPAKVKDINRDDWAPLGNRVDHCLSEQVPGLCRVQFSLSIAWTVIAFNVSKVAILLIMFFFLREDPLTTMGDAVASFLDRKDEMTAGLCLMTRNQIALWAMPPTPQPYSMKGIGRHWFDVVSRGRWWFCMCLYAAAIGVCLGLLIHGTSGQPLPSSSLMSIPIGSLNPATFIFGWNVPQEGNSGLVGNVLVANSPQLILSMIYYTYNSLFTCFFMGREWASYATQRKGLRVSKIPHGQQRSTYFLQLPYKVAFPLMALSGVLHWLTSQSIFLVSMQETIQLRGTGTYTNLMEEFFTCGYSPPAILSVVLLGLAMVALVSFFGLRAFKGGMPIVATSSACISAFCHVPDIDEEVDAAYRPVSWGIVDPVDKDNQTSGTSHCTFSSQYVRLPEEGEMCAGLKHKTVI